MQGLDAIKWLVIAPANGSSNATTEGPEDLPPPHTLCVALRIIHSGDRDAVGKVFPLDGSEWIIGRSQGPGAIDDPRVSREHLRIYQAEDGCRIEDLESTSGTFVDGLRLGNESALLAEGQVIRFGGTLAVVDKEPDPDTLPADTAADETLASSYIGVSYYAQRVRRSIATVAPKLGPVLLLGPTGAGKDVVAAEIARLSGSSRYVAVNTTAIATDRFEAEFFGWKKGAFTGAMSNHDGFFVQASGGTLFLDEIGDVPLEAQPKLLRSLQDGTIQPLGSEGPPVKVRVRIIAATNRDVRGSNFREDLLRRLHQWELHLLPLSGHRADILAVWKHFVGQQSRTDIECSADFAEALLVHEFPGNVRELAHLAGRTLGLLGAGMRFEISHLPEKMQELIRTRMPRPPPPSEDSPEVTEAALRGALEEEGGNVAGAMRKLGIRWREQMRRLLKKYQIDPEAYRRR